MKKSKNDRLFSALALMLVLLFMICQLLCGGILPAKGESAFAGRQPRWTEVSARQKGGSLAGATLNN